ncbi:hypothetical protein [Nonomuraea sp. NPDC049784]|uniref:hypothetical protein n=1 Tax=Nonomuraea sp. NPDC049784 TaxID=3154361 RepID=UPI0033C8F26F
MSNKVTIALAVLAGYYLGRRRKLCMVAALAAAGLAGRVPGGGGGVLAQGIKTLRSSPEVGQITDRLRGDLLEVGKAAAVAATSRQIDSLSDRLHERAEALRTPGTAKHTGPPTKQAAGDETDEDSEDEGYKEGEGEEEDDEDEKDAERGGRREFGDPDKAQRRSRPVRGVGQPRM